MLKTTEEAKTKKIRGVFQRPPGSNIWWISYFSDGQRKREKVGRKSDAINLYRIRKTEVLSGSKIPVRHKTTSVTFAQLCDAIGEYSRNHHKDVRTVEQRLSFLRRAFGERVADTIKPAEIDSWLIENTKTPATANRYRALISLCYREAIRNGKLTHNPARLVRQRMENNGRLRFLSHDEEGRLRRAMAELCPDRLPELDISLKTGMRRSEQYGLRWKQVDFKARQINLPKTKNGTHCIIPMSAGVVQAFETRFADSIDRTDEGRVFAHLEAGKWFKDALESAKVKGYTWHSNRHTFCSRLAENGAGISTIAQLAGHKTISMSARYIHLTDTSLAAAVSRLD